MKKAIIITGEYFPKPLANGICADAIALELKKRDYNVDIICFDMETGKRQDYIKDGIAIHNIKPRLFYRLRSWGEKRSNSLIGRFIFKFAIFENRIKRTIFLPWYPMSSLMFINRYYKMAKKIHKNKKIDVIISVYTPFESLIAGMMLKKKYSDIKYCAYILDTLTNSSTQNNFKNNYFSNRGWKWEKKVYSKADLILNMKCHEEHHNDVKYNKYREKMEIVDIPLFNCKKIINSKENYYNNNCINWCYTGALEFGLRSPEYICKIITKINDFNKNRVHFFSRGNCESLLLQYKKSTNGVIVQHGYVPKEEIKKAIYDCDILLSIGNNQSDMIPSKIFEYMATGKKIIHFYKDKNDTCIPYFKLYSKVLLINENDDDDSNINKINSFIQKEDKSVDLNKLKKLLEMNTPEYTVDKIEKLFL